MKKIVVCVTGASGSIYAKRLLHFLSKENSIQTHAIFTEESKNIWKEEIGDFAIEKQIILDENSNMRISYASGSSVADAVIVCPCTMNTLAKVSSGIADNLITRACDVALKERKKLILLIRESPYNLTHIENMRKATLAGAVIMPASPSFYFKPDNILSLVDSVVERVLDHVGIIINQKRYGQ